MSQWTVQEIGTRCHFFLFFFPTLSLLLFSFFSLASSHMSHQVHMYCRWLQSQAVVSPDAFLLLVKRSVLIRVCPSTTAIYQRQTSLSNILATDFFISVFIASLSLEDECCPRFWCLQPTTCWSCWFFLFLVVSF